MRLGVQPVAQIMAMLRAMLLEDAESGLGDLVVRQPLLLVVEWKMGGHARHAASNGQPLHGVITPSRASWGIHPMSNAMTGAYTAHMTTSDRARHQLLAIALLASALSTAMAMDGDVRLVPQLAIGSSGFEPGLAVELRNADTPTLIVRPEILLSEDGTLGAGGALLIDLATTAQMPARQSLAIGPRVVFHNADRSGLEADMMGLWGFDLSDGVGTWRHSVGLLAAGGVLRDPRHDELDLGITAGIYYAFRL